MNTRRRTATGVAATLLVVAGCGGDDEAAPTTTTEPAPTTSEPAPTTIAATTIATTTTTVEAIREPAIFAPDAPPLTERFMTVEPGAHRIDRFGTPFTFTTEEPWVVQRNAYGMFVLTHTGSLGADDRDIVVLRPLALSDPAAPTKIPDEPGEGWPIGDYEGWLERMSDSLLISHREETMLGGLPATRVDLEVDETECPLGEPCVLFVASVVGSEKLLLPGSSYRIWFVDQGDSSPIVVIVGINRDADVAWFEQADAMLSTLAFGDVAPNPITAAEAGPVEADFLGGVRFELPDAAVLVQEPGLGAVMPYGQPGDAEFLTRPTDMDGNVLTTADELLAVFEEGGIVVTEIDGMTIGGWEARAFDFGTPGGRGAVLRRSPDTRTGWAPPPRARIWLIEHPDRGLLMATAEAWVDPDTVLPEVLAITEPILESLEFIDRA